MGIILMYLQALLLSPLNASTLACMGYVQALLGEVAASVETFHKALGLRRDDSFSTTMLTYVIEILMDEAPPFAGKYISLQSFHVTICNLIY